MRLLTAQPLTAAVVGFSPGFAYLEGLPAPLQRVPRRSRPRPVVPAGSVAIANGHAAVYPTASPGGWHLVGRTGFPLFNAERSPYAVLAPGDRVRFSVAGRGRSRRARAGGRTAVVPARRTPGPSSRSWRRACAPWCRTAGAGPSRPSGSRRPARPTRCRSTLANRLTGNEAGVRRARAHGGRHAAALSRPLPRRGRRRRAQKSGSTAPRSGPGSCCHWTPARCWRSAVRAAAAAATWRWPAGSSAPSGSAAPPPTS